MTVVHVVGTTLDIPKDNLVLLRDHPEGRNKIQYIINLNYSPLYQSIRTIMFTKFTQCVGVQSIQSTDDNWLTSRSHLLEIMGTLTQWTHPIILDFLITSQRKFIPIALPISIIMVPGPRFGPALYCSFQLQMKIVTLRLQITCKQLI